MKCPNKKSILQSFFFNLRGLIGLLVFLAGIFLALYGWGALSSVFRPGHEDRPIFQARVIQTA
jgi:hypothetical protein